MAVAQVMHAGYADAALIERCRRRDEAAFAEVVARYKTKIYNYVCRMMGNDDDAEDITQEVFIRMYQSLGTFRQQSSLNTWVFRIASNLCIDQFRRRKKHQAIAYSLDDTDDSGDKAGLEREVPDATYEPQRLLANSEMSAQIDLALTHLPDKLRAVVLLYDLEELSYEEIARVLEIPVGTVKSRLFNARLQLRKRLSDYLNQE
ncbi:sigma-70 family RNA polymerase sigma factor [Capsulimonas corticalis]|nr:sigma-70 family RNA polymerase sigma factor [Capsulimonas corticalis]